MEEPNKLVLQYSFTDKKALLQRLIGMTCKNEDKVGEDDFGYLCYSNQYDVKSSTFFHSRVYYTCPFQPETQVIKIGEFEYLIKFVPTEYGIGKFYVQLSVL